MNPAYNSKLHNFVEMYFNARGANIEDIQDNYFSVKFPDGRRETYTYSARIAAENKDIRLLARGSRSLTQMIQECSSRSAFSEVRISYTEQSVKASLSPKKCCSLCPFISICEDTGTCCDFCSYCKSCNTSITNADFIRFGDTKAAENLDILCFVFAVELSNDYSLGQKAEKDITILVDLHTGKTLKGIPVNDIQALQADDPGKSTPISDAAYHKLLTAARHEASEILQNQLDVFKSGIEGPLKEKIKSIIGKFEEEYIESYTKYTLEQLNQLQDEAVRLCEREIRGYTINCDYHLKNVILMHTAKEQRDLVFKLHDNGREVTLPAEIFLNRIDIKCSQCGTEIDKGTVCGNGHILCGSCSEICCSCGKVICDTCDDESSLCSTCGEIVCSECMKVCSSCGAVLCPSHAYVCSSCGEVFCIDCYEICSICGSSVCKTHSETCTSCGKPVCRQHTHKCSVCGRQFCTADVNECAVCGTVLCKEHTVHSLYSGKALCESHISKCDRCDGIFANDEIVTCMTCGAELCPTHVSKCSSCGQAYCDEHINYCKACGNKYCSCTPFSVCKLCGMEYCPDCISKDGYCKACCDLQAAAETDDSVQAALSRQPSLAKYKRFYKGTSHDITVLYAKGILQSRLIVIGKDYSILCSKDLSLIESIKHKSILSRGGKAIQ